MNELWWWLTRATGVVALLALTASLVLGILARSGRDVAGLGRFGANEVHRTAATTAAGLVAVHVATLLLDTVSGIGPLNVLVPFTGSYRPLWVGFGVLALDVLVAVVVTGTLRRRVGTRAFRAVHLTTYALWPLAALHFLGSGTDAGTWWARTLLVVTTGAVVAAVGWRLTPGFVRGGRPTRTPQRVLTLSGRSPR